MILEIVAIGVGAAGVTAFMGGLYWVSTYNRLQTLHEAVGTMMSNLQTEYQRRIDVFLNMGEVVKSFKNHEKETFVELAKARNPNYFPGTMGGKVAKMNMLESFFSRLMVQMEKYPDLKAGALHEKLMQEVQDTEVRVNMARGGYNEIVREANTMVRNFPTNIIAGFHGIKVLEYPQWAVDPKPNQAAPKLGL